MTAVIALVNLFIVIVCQPWLVEPPTEILGTAPVYILNPADLEFVIDEDESTIPWKDTITVLGIICLILYGCYQHVLMKNEFKEIQEILDKCIEYHEQVMEIPKFYTETEKTISVLETQSKILKTRFQKVQKTLNATKDNDKLKEDMDFIRDSWMQQFNAFSVLNVDINGEVMSDNELKAQLVIINGLFGRELRTIEGHMTEDMLSLEEVVRDVQILQKYLGK